MTTTPQTPPANSEPQAAGLETTLGTAGLDAGGEVAGEAGLSVRGFRCISGYSPIFLPCPLMAAATAFFGCVSLVCGLWDRLRPAAAFCGADVGADAAASGFLAGGGDWRGEAEAGADRGLRVEPPELHGHTGAVPRLPFQFRILAKGGLWKVPFAGRYPHRSGQVPIHSGSPRSLIAGLLRGVKALESGMPLVVFPEGARTPTGEMQTLASGCAFMAIRAGVLLVPLALIGTYELLPIHTYALRPRPLKIVVGDAISTEGMTTRDADALTARLFSEITRLYQLHGG